ncbi:MAG: 5-formyltetrahydrofolate cyclo-ligase [Spirochaetales bacterium]|nr:5-formyltetrahydrofolate cyclo-ligase [Spirochaetales bacterium]
MDKKSLRKNMLSLIKHTHGPDPVCVADRICSLEEYKQADYVFAFIPLKGEIDLSILIDRAIAEKKTVAVPDLEPGLFRIAEKGWRDDLETLPNKTKTLAHSSVLNINGSGANIHAVGPTNGLAKGIILVPGLAFTEFGTRLGRGAGYYDQLLELMASSAFADIIPIGICREAQLVGDLPQQPHDKKVRMVLTF